MRKDRLIEVCDKCKTAACWYGEFMCDAARYAGTIKIRKSNLEKMNLEHPDYWSDEKLNELYGSKLYGN